MNTDAGAVRTKRVVIIGGGFGGTQTAQALKGRNVDVIVVDRRNHHIFQPLLYQVATAVLAPSEVAAPLRQLAHRQSNLSVILGEATEVDLAVGHVNVVPTDLPPRIIPYDYLVIASGVRPTYFGHDEFAAYAPALKTLTDAESIRARILAAFEFAEQTDDLDARARALTFVLVGAGATGVELAASIAQMARVTLASNFRRINPALSKIVLLDAASRVLPSFHETLSAKAAERLEALGVTIVTGVTVQSVDALGVVAGGNRIESNTVLWTAGVRGSAIVETLRTKTDRAGRALVDERLSIEHHPNVFVIGDAASLMQGERPLPGVAQVAVQQGRFVGRQISAALEGDSKKAGFRYSDRGNMAVVGKNFAVFERGRLRLSGVSIWFVWAFIHVMFLPQPQNRLRVQLQWLWSYMTGQRSSRLIPEAKETPVPARNRSE
jgi:NADH dehydrogenase